MNLTTEAATCSSETGICSLPGPCANQYDLLSKYSFKIQFNDASGENYLRVPLNAFAVDARVSGEQQCNVMVTNGAPIQNSVYLGALFF